MIQRIKKIRQVGVFADCNNSGKHNFDKVTVIYGLNAQGKTTLKDTFSALNKDNLDLVTNRKTIPANGNTQEVEVDYGALGVRGTTISLSSTNWQNNQLKDNLLIFDNDFIHENLISGQEVTRRNKESFTDFILGEEGVKLSEKIKELNQKVRSKKEEIKTIKEILPKGLSEDSLKKFIAFSVTEPLESILAAKAKIEKEIANLNSTVNIGKLPEISLQAIGVTGDLNNFLESVNTLLAKDYSEINSIALEHVESHLANKTKNIGSTEKWIREGTLLHTKNDDCPFCGQSLTNVDNLISDYRDFFNTAFEQYVDNITESIRVLKQSINILKAKDYTKDVEDTKNQLLKYKDYLPDLDYDFSTEEINYALTQYQTELQLFTDNVERLFSQKEAKPHIAIESIALTEELIKKRDALLSAVKKISDLIQPNTEAAQNLKQFASKPQEELTARHEELNKEMDLVEWKMRRLASNDSCESYKKSNLELATLETEVTTQITNLETQQSAYLDTYFGDVDAYYKKFGNGDFEIKKKTDNRGDKKVYYLDIVFHGKSLNDAEIADLMSESEKRSLALSIFLARIKFSTDKDKKIVVLDDPVVSFDANRCSVTVDLIKALSNEFCQIIVLTHYPLFVGDLIDMVKSDVVFLEVSRDNVTASLSNLDTESFTESPLNNCLRNIIRFINRENNNNILEDCRILMEKYLGTRFKPTIISQNISTHLQLSDLIDALFDAKAFDVNTKTELHCKREGLNPCHHNFSDSTKVENSRTYAKEVIDFLYSI
jgi:wobble nucleotide-excising tRNase